MRSIPMPGSAMTVQSLLGLLSSCLCPYPAHLNSLSLFCLSLKITKQLAQPVRLCVSAFHQAVLGGPYAVPFEPLQQVHIIGKTLLAL